MEIFPAANEEQFSYIQKQISDSDYYVLVIGARYGSTAEDGISYTEREFDYALEQGIPILVFPIKDPRSLPTYRTDEDPVKAKELSRFREKACLRRVAKFWSTSTELSLNVIQALKKATEVSPRPGWIRGDTVASADIIEAYLKLQEEYASLQERYKQAKGKEVAFDPKQLSSWVQIECANRKSKKRYTVRLTVNDILQELTITEFFNEDTLELAAKGAITHKIDIDFDDVEITEWQLDRVIVLLARLDIADLIENELRIIVTRGKNFLPANILVKSKGSVDKGESVAEIDE